MSDLSADAKARPRWVPSPLLQGAKETPRFLRAPWDAQQAHAFGPWRVAERSDPAVAAEHSPGPEVGNTPVQAALPAPGHPDPAVDATPVAAPALVPLAPPDKDIEALVADRVRQAQEEAHARGIEEGRAQARAEIEVERAQEGELLRHLAIELRALSDDPDRFFEPLRRLALHIAEQLVRGELATSGAAIAQIVRQCLAALDSTSDKIVVSLHPDDAALLESMAPAFLQGLRLQPEPALTRGSVRLRLDDTVLEDLIEHRLEALAAPLMMPPARAAESVLLKDYAPRAEMPSGLRRPLDADNIIDAAAMPVRDDTVGPDLSTPPVRPAAFAAPGPLDLPADLLDLPGPNASSAEPDMPPADPSDPPPEGGPV